MRPVTRHFITGLTTIIALVGVVYLLFRFGDLDGVLRPRYDVTVLINRAAGLRPGSNVELNGVQVGQIGNVTIGDDPAYPVVITARVEAQYSIPETATPEIVESIIGGNSTLLLVSDPAEDGSKPGVLPKDGSARLRGLHTPLVDRITLELERQFHPLVAALEDFRGVGSTFREVGENINALIGTPDDPDPDQKTIASLVANMNGRLSQVETALDNANRWLGDEQLQMDVQRAVTHASELIENATAAVERYTLLADQLEGEVAGVAKAIVPVADHVSMTLAEVQTLLSLATSGQGSVAQALNNPDLYLSLTDASTRLEKTLKDVQLLIEKLRAEGIKIGL